MDLNAITESWASDGMKESKDAERWSQRLQAAHIPDVLCTLAAPGTP